MNNSNRRTRIILITGLLLILIAGIIGIIAPNYPDSITISDLRICQNNLGVDKSSDGQQCGQEFQTSTASILVCGSLNPIPGIFEPTVYLYKNGKKYPVFYGSLVSQANGHFCLPIPLLSDDTAGNYVLKIYYFRKLIAATNFINK